MDDRGGEMSRSSMARVAAAAAGALVVTAGIASYLRRRRLQSGALDAKDIARRLAEDPWKGKVEETLQLVADDYVAYVPGSVEPFRGKEGLRQFLSAYLAAFPDGKLVVDDQIADGDFVATRWTAKGTNTGELMGIPASGRQVTVKGITYARISGGKARESWLSWDTLSMMQQLGAVPEAAPTQS
jgi:steroid delta-isomerase-like uncharacterized protein